MKVRVNGVSLFCAESGNPSGLPILFLHGFPFDHRMWRSQIEATTRLYRAIAYDIRGHGASDVGDGQYMIEGHVEDLVGLMDHLEIGRAVVVGLSMGGYITLRALEKHPQRFIAAVLCDTRSEPDSNEGKLKRHAGIELVRKAGSAGFAESFVGGLFAPGNLKSHVREKEEIRKTIENTSPLSIAGTLIALAARTDTTPSLQSIKVPTLIMVGEFDQLTPPAASEAMHERIPGSQLHIVPAAAHMSNLENPEFFNERLLQFLKMVSDMEAHRTAGS